MMFTKFCHTQGDSQGLQYFFPFNTLSYLKIILFSTEVTKTYECNYAKECMINLKISNQKHLFRTSWMFLHIKASLHHKRILSQRIMTSLILKLYPLYTKIMVASWKTFQKGLLFCQSRLNFAYFGEIIVSKQEDKKCFYTVKKMKVNLNAIQKTS